MGNENRDCLKQGGRQEPAPEQFLNLRLPLSRAKKANTVFVFIYVDVHHIFNKIMYLIASFMIFVVLFVGGYMWVCS